MSALRPRLPGVARPAAVPLMLVTLALVTASLARAGYQDESDFLPATPSVTAGAAGAFFNPAAWAAVGRAETVFWWDDRDVRDDDLDAWGLSHGGPLGFSVATRTLPDGSGGSLRVHDYQLGFAAGDRRGHFGAAWRWSTGDDDAFGREDGLALGLIHRPGRHVTLGLSGFFENAVSAREGIADLGVRPFADPWLTLFGEVSIVEGQTLADGRWGGGAEVRPVPGLHVGMRMRETGGADDFHYSLNVGLTFDEIGFHVQPRYREGGDRLATTYLARLNPPHRGLPVRRMIRERTEPTRVVPIPLENRTLSYQRDRWFDSNRVAWIDLARYLDRIADEPSVMGVTLNLSGFRVRGSLAWELRKKLEMLQERGKEVYVYADRLGMNGTYLASTADRLVLDPYGHLLIPGIALQRTYLGGLLDKLDLGAEEWRFFSHKTAFETYTRTSMSDADREQYTRIADVLYETWREGICRSRNLPHEEFDHVVDSIGRVQPQVALDRGLIDAVGRPVDLEDWVTRERGGRIGGLPVDPDRGVLPDERWGRPPIVAVVYAVGPCAMDSGIRGRATSKALRDMAKNPDVAAVVLRADSPGGDPLPSDLVADAMVALRDAGKPVVVSQGSVAASGGYWISMEGETIFTTPLTLTGSIGVIAGWIWDEGFGERTGFSADGVQRGRHADLFTGIRYPFVDQPLPRRNLTDEEKGAARDQILELYRRFVERVAHARNLDEAVVREVAEGRVWMGGDAIDRGLADGFGGLDDAVAEARARAGIAPEDEVLLIEFPERRWFRLPQLVPDLPGLRGLAQRLWAPEPAGEPVAAIPDFGWTYLRTLAAHPGRPLLLTPPELLPDGWGEED